MGTRAIVRVMNGNSEILCLYRQFDGYLDGLGQELADFARQFTVVNGIPADDDRKLANGMGCFAAQLVKHLKEEVGNVYVLAPGTKDHGEEFTYILAGGTWADIGPGETEQITLQVHEGPVTFFGGSSEQGTENHLFSGSCSEFDPEKIEEAYH